jgi:peptidoglycan/xylan/chitin deacetylase (PgdA/CDA1 family)
MVGRKRLFESKFHFVSVEGFESMLKKLKNKFRFVFVDEFFESLKPGRSIDTLACVTFDDGYAETLRCVSPVLEKLSVPATFYVNSSLVERSVLWRDKIRFLIDNNLVEDFINEFGFDNIRVDKFYEMTKRSEYISSKTVDTCIDNFLARRNQTLHLNDVYCSLEDLKAITSQPFLMIGNHSHRHYLLSTLSREEQLSEIETCQSYLENNFPREKISEIFSMPFGGYHTFNDITIECLKKLNFKGAVISEPKAYYDDSSLLEVSNGFYMYKRFLPKH